MATRRCQKWSSNRAEIVITTAKCIRCRHCGRLPGMPDGRSANMPTDGRRQPYIGRPLPRFEDRRLVAGRGRFTDDFSIDGQAYAVFVRSPHAHARIESIDTGAAAQRAGVIAVFTASDYAASGGRGIGHIANPAGTHDVKIKAFTGEG